MLLSSSVAETLFVLGCFFFFFLVLLIWVWEIFVLLSFVFDGLQRVYFILMYFSSRCVRCF